jgi:hypothetical protein
MPDDTEALRQGRLVEINARPGSRSELEARYGQVWDTGELGRDFEVIAFWHRSSWSGAGRMA